MARRGTRPTRRAVAALIVLGLAGCGSTAQSPQNLSGGPVADPFLDGAGSPVGTSGTTTPASGPDVGLRAGSTRGAGTASSGTGAASGPVTGAGRMSSAGGKGSLSRSVPKGGPVSIGIQYRTGDDTAHAAFGTGAEDVPSGENYMRWWRAVIEDANVRGGVLGHELVPVFYPQDANSSQTPDAQDQAACANFTQDNKVAAALISGFHTRSLLNCLAKTGTFILAPGGMAFDDREVFQQYPGFGLAGGIDLHRAARVYVDGLVQQGFLTARSKIGLVSYSADPFARSTEQSLKPTLAKHGMKVLEEVQVEPLTTLGGAGNAGAPLSNAVLRFRAADVDRVLFLASSGTAFVFLTAAESQAYRPLYGLNSNDTPQALAGTAPAAQLTGAKAVGWTPSYDVPSTGPPSPGQKRCDDIIRKATGKKASAAYGVCDQVQVYVQAATAGGGFDAASVSRGLQMLGALQLAAVPHVAYTAGVRDGVSKARHIAFRDDCTCFEYTSAPYSIE